MSPSTQDRKKPRRFLGINFTPDISLVDIVVIVSVALSGIGVYTSNVARAETQQIAIDNLNKENFPSRMTAVEVRTEDITKGLGLIHEDLMEIRKSLDSKQDKKN